MSDVYKKTFPVRSRKKKRVYRFDVGELLLVLNVIIIDVLYKEISIEQDHVYFTVIGQAFHELWQLETRHANARNLGAVLNFIPDPVFWIMRV